MSKKQSRKETVSGPEGPTRAGGSQARSKTPPHTGSTATKSTTTTNKPNTRNRPTNYLQVPDDDQDRDQPRAERDTDQPDDHVQTRAERHPSPDVLTSDQQSPAVSNSQLYLGTSVTEVANSNVAALYAHSSLSPSRVLTNTSEERRGHAPQVNLNNSTDSIHESTEYSSTNLRVYITPLDSSVSLKADIAKKPKQYLQYFQYNFGYTKQSSWVIRDNFLRIDCTTYIQKRKLLSCTQFMDNQVKVTEPWAVTGENQDGRRQRRNSPVDITGTQQQQATHQRTQNHRRLKRVVIHGLSEEVTEDDILNEVEGVITVKRLISHKTGVPIPTQTVILGFEEEPPARCKVYFTSFKTHPYIPKPMQCIKCMAYGHVAANCGRRTICPYCGAEGHTYNECVHKGNASRLHCIHCKEPHSSRSKSCEHYKLVQNALISTVRNGKTYKDALDEQRKIATEQQQQQNHDQTDALETHAKHSTPFARPTGPPKQTVVRDCVSDITRLCVLLETAFKCIERITDDPAITVNCKNKRLECLKIETRWGIQMVAQDYGHSFQNHAIASDRYQADAESAIKQLEEEIQAAENTTLSESFCHINNRYNQIDKNKATNG